MVIQMVELETVEELAEDIANMADVYGISTFKEHEESCECRVCFVLRMTERIRQAVANEKLLYAAPRHKEDTAETVWIVGTMFYNY
jgi:hypothetical protein